MNEDTEQKGEAELYEEHRAEMRRLGIDLDVPEQYDRVHAIGSILICLNAVSEPEQSIAGKTILVALKTLGVGDNELEAAILDLKRFKEWDKKFGSQA